MRNYQHLCLKSCDSITDAARILNQNIQKICLVVDELVLKGTITDGDIRRGLLKGISLDAPVTAIMNANPHTITDTSNYEDIQNRMSEQKLFHLPVIDLSGRLTGLISLDEVLQNKRPHDTWVILMAGGLGERLRPFTNNTPKPLLKIGGKPLLQSILENFIEQNFDKFYIAVNYQAEAIKEYFGNGRAWNVTIRYLEEKQRMGTAGALTLLTEMPTHPLIIMNADLVTHINFNDLLEFHTAQNSNATMCVREYDFQVPFGVVGMENNRISSIDEKPVHRFFVNAGIYVLNPVVVATIPQNKHYDMTEVFEHAIIAGEETAAFPIHEYWLDIGRVDDLQRAQVDYRMGREN